MAEDVRDAPDRSVGGNLRKRRAHHFADHQLAQVFSLQREIQNLVFVNGADGMLFLKNGNLRNVRLLDRKSVV